MNYKDQREDLLRRIDKALAGMEARGAKDRVCLDGINHYDALQEKRDRIASGSDFEVINKAEDMIKFVGSLIPNINMNLKGELIKDNLVRKKAEAKAKRR